MDGLSFRALSEHSMAFCGIDGAVAMKLLEFLPAHRAASNHEIVDQVGLSVFVYNAAMDRFLFISSSLLCQRHSWSQTITEIHFRSEEMQPICRSSSRYLMD